MANGQANRLPASESNSEVSNKPLTTATTETAAAKDSQEFLAGATVST